MQFLNKQFCFTADKFLKINISSEPENKFYGNLLLIYIYIGISDNSSSTITFFVKMFNYLFHT